MSGPSLFGKGGGEYLTFHFKDGEEHLARRSLFSESNTLHKIIDHNNQIHIQHVAGATFSNLTAYLSGKHPPLTHENVTDMIKAAKMLGLVDTVKSLSSFLGEEKVSKIDQKITEANQSIGMKKLMKKISSLFNK